MEKQTKVQQLGCTKVVSSGIEQGKTLREIAQDCSDSAGEPVSYGSIRRYLESQKDTNQKEKKEFILQDKRRLLKTVNQELDIIQLQLETTASLLDRFKLIDDLPAILEEQIEQLIKTIPQHSDVEELSEFLESWQTKMDKEMRRKVLEMTSLNRELRENSKFLTEIRAKAFAFSLVQEYLALFMQKFREESTDGAFERTLQYISANPRMQQIVDQQRILSAEI